MPLWLLIPGALLLWSFLARRDESRLPPRNLLGLPPRRGPALGSPMHGPLNAGDHLAHVHEATAATRVLDSVKPLALNADISSLMQAPPDVAAALGVLSAPLSVAMAQKDFNVLGAVPALPEDGHLGPATLEAIRGIQTRFGQPPTGKIDSATAVAIRYAVGCIYSQDRATF